MTVLLKIIYQWPKKKEHSESFSKAISLQICNKCKRQDFYWLYIQMMWCCVQYLKVYKGFLWFSFELGLLTLLALSPLGLKCCPPMNYKTFLYYRLKLASSPLKGTFHKNLAMLLNTFLLNFQFQIIFVFFLLPLILLHYCLCKNETNVIYWTQNQIYCSKRKVQVHICTIPNWLDMLVEYTTLTTTSWTKTCSGNLMGAWKCMARATSR